jgi:5-methylcytosine-specific restriction endonuclease McrA
MSTNQRTSKKTCAYCGSPTDLTRDHVPPKNLFPLPKPVNLITVPACKKCHSETSQDDEYFRVKILLYMVSVQAPQRAPLEKQC